MRLMVSTLLVVSLSLLLKNVRIPKSIDLHEALPHPEKTMTAVVYDQHSADPRSLRIDHSYPQPVPGKHQVLVRVAAASLNPVDYKLRRNYAPNLLIHKPRIPGLDVSGEVVEVGSEVHGWKIGDPVAALLPALMTRWGSLADYVAIDASLLARIPSGMDVRKAASIPLVGITVLQSFARIRDNLDGKKVLIHAGAGGVGSFACQYAAKLLGMQVAVTASASKAEFLKSIGADIVVDYHTTRFEDVISGYDLIIDSMSWEYERRNLKPGVLKPTGHYVRYGSSIGRRVFNLPLSSTAKHVEFRQSFQRGLRKR